MCIVFPILEYFMRIIGILHQRISLLRDFMTFLGVTLLHSQALSHDISDRKFLATDIEGVESVGAGGAVFEEVFLGFDEFLA
jgi:hypothetical protein